MSNTRLWRLKEKRHMGFPRSELYWTNWARFEVRKTHLLKRLRQRRALTMTACNWLSRRRLPRSEEHTSELQSLMRISYAVFCLKKKTTNRQNRHQSVQPKLIQHNACNRKHQNNNEKVNY